MSARDDANQPAAEIPFGCRHCGDAQHHHGWQHAPGAGLHQWVRPTGEQVKARMLARRQARGRTTP